MKPQQMIIKSWLCHAKRETAKVSVITLLVLALGLTLFVLAGCHQAEKITKNLPNLPNLQGFVDMALGRSVSTNIKDAYPVAFWLDGVGKKQPPKQASTLELTPGHYRIRLQSYCLQAGSYGPIATEGHLLAPLRGSQADMIRSILHRSADFPQISQQDIQQVMWSLESGLSFSELPRGLQQRTRPLVGQIGIQDIVNSLEMAKSLAKLALPEKTQKLLHTYEALQEKLRDARLTFQAIERFTVLVGTAPVGPGSRSLSPGHWSYAGNGFYARTFPESYSTTICEVYRPKPYQLKRDNKGRIVVFEVGDTRIDTVYHNGSENDYVQLPNGRQGHIWRLKSVKISGPKQSEGIVLRNPGWVVASGNSPATIAGIKAQDFDSGLLAFDADLTVSPSSGIILDDARQKNYGARAKDFYRRSKWISDQKKKLGEYREELERASRPADERAVKDIIDIHHFNEGLKAVKDFDTKGKVEWIGKHALRTHKVWEYASKQLESVYGALKYAFAMGSGDLSESDVKSGSRHRRFDPSGLVSAPANTSRQPLGLSARFAR